MTVWWNPQPEEKSGSLTQVDKIQTEKTDTEVQEDSAAEAPAKPTEEGLTMSTATSGGRRRGRRKVMKKKMLKDEEGYLGTYALWASKSIQPGAFLTLHAKQ